MTPRVREHGPDKRAQGVWGVQDLRERPVPNHEIYPGDRAIEYLWSGHKLKWMDLGGDEFLDDFTWTEDATVDFSGYISNGSGSDGDTFFIAAPLGPRWSVWGLDICYGRGPDYGDIYIDWATAPFFRRAEGTSSDPTTVGTGANFDFPNPTGGIYYVDPGFDWHNIYSLTFYNGTETFDNYTAAVGPFVRLTGEYGAMLMDPDVGTGEPIGGQSFDSGDGVMYYLRFRINGKDASSTGYKARIQALRLSRVAEGQATPI